ncbi:MAG: hypothetical protein ABI743_01545 [bacterium]
MPAANTPTQNLINALTGRTGCSVDEATQALHVTGQDFVAAEQYLQRTRPVYLMVVAIIEELGRSSKAEGLLVLFYDRKQPRPRFIQVYLTTTAGESILREDIDSPLGWATAAKAIGDRLTGYDRTVSNQLENALRNLPFPGTIESYFTLPKHSVRGSDELAGAPFLEEALQGSLQATLAEQLSFQFNLGVCWQPLTIPDCATVASRTGWQLPILEAVTSTAKTAVVSTERLNKVFEGLPLVDAEGQIPLYTLRPGDKLAMQVLDDSAVGLRIAEELGVRSGSRWLPAWTKVLELTEQPDGQVRVLTEICPQLSVEAVVPGMIRVAARLNDRTHPPRLIPPIHLQPEFVYPITGLILAGAWGMFLLAGHH